MIWGIDVDVWSTITANAQGFTGVIGYDNASAGTNGIPATWSACNVATAPTYVCQIECFKPEAISTLSGLNDTLLLNFLSGAPTGAMIVPWQEANGSTSDWSYGAPKFKDICAYIQGFVQKHGLPILVGQKFERQRKNEYTEGLQDWVRPGMDWYGIDVYQTAAADTPDSRFSPGIADIYAVSGKLAGITETNTNQDIPTWTNLSWQYATANNLPFLFTWWQPSGVNYIWNSSYAPTFNAIAPQAARQHLSMAAKL